MPERCPRGETSTGCRRQSGPAHLNVFNRVYYLRFPEPDLEGVWVRLNGSKRRLCAPAGISANRKTSVANSAERISLRKARRLSACDELGPALTE
jgi:hypothetical protein